jgi:hypothetical protein
MTGHAETPQMRPEFKAHLEWQIESALRRETRFADPATRQVSRLSRLTSALALLAAIAFGAGVVAAAEGMQEAKQRNALIDAVKSEEALARLRLQLAESNYQEARRKFEVGTATPDAVQAAEAELQTTLGRIKRLVLDMEEIHATAQAVRNDLQAPLVGQRDFVSERIQVDLQSAQAALVTAERAMANTKRRFDVGLATRITLLQAETDMAQARARLVELQETLELRRRALNGEVKKEDLASGLRRLELSSQQQSLERQLRLAQARVEEVRRQTAVGQASELDLKRAEVELLERQVELKQLQQELEKLATIKR